MKITGGGSDTVLKHHGDVKTADFTKFKGYDLLIGGSPCQGFSKAGKQLNFEDPRSALFFEFVRALKEAQPRYFLLENVSMKKEYEDTITNILGVQPIKINSKLFSAQNRPRTYWTNLPINKHIESKEFKLSDILENDLNFKEVADRYVEYSNFFIIPRGTDGNLINGSYNRIWKIDKLCGALSVCNVQKIGFEKDGKIYARKITPTEAERLQTLPDGYTKSAPDNQRYKMLGNGWTVDVIAYLLSHIEP